MQLNGNNLPIFYHYTDTIRTKNDKTKQKQKK